MVARVAMAAGAVTAVTAAGAVMAVTAAGAATAAGVTTPAGAAGVATVAGETAASRSGSGGRWLTPLNAVGVTAQRPQGGDPSVAPSHPKWDHGTPARAWPGVPAPRLADVTAFW